MQHEADAERYFTRAETELYVAGLQTVRSTLITHGPALLAILLFLLARPVLGDKAFFRYRVWDIFLIPLITYTLVEWCRSRARVIVTGEHVRAAAPLLGTVDFEFDHFRKVTVIEPNSSHWAPSFMYVWSLIFTGLLLIVAVYEFFFGTDFDPVILLFVAVSLVLTLQAHRQRTLRQLELDFGPYPDWRRHLWQRQKLVVRGPEGMLRELKYQVEAAAEQVGK